jgi:hypothetical protein
VIDLTNPTQPHEIAYYDATVGGSADTWSSYWYNGTIYANDIARGIDAFTVARTNTTGATWDHLNAQTQETLLDLPVPHPGFG